MALTLVTNGWDCCTYPYNGGQSCFLLVYDVNVLKWWCILRLAYPDVWGFVCVRINALGHQFER